jgi:hypothetical protein
LIKVIVFQCPVGEVIVTGFWALHLGVRKFLVLLEKEFKDGHRGDLSRGRFIINAKQSQSKVKAKQKCTLQTGGWAGSRASTMLEVPRPQAFIGVCSMEVVSSGRLG